ncbi:MAG: NACHT domain-containing protein [Chloroflexota bacterium]|nr:NACHT domain-containing protein [Chloroflexota bacterium]
MRQLGVDTNTGASTLEADRTTLTWTDLRERAARQQQAFLRELRGWPDKANVFIPEAYVPRKDAENSLDKFLHSPDQETALIVIGETGAGKTNLLCRWADKLTADGQVVFFYDCRGSLTVEIERRVVQDLGLENSNELSDAVVAQIRALSGNDRRFVLLFDGLEGFDVGTEIGTADLLKAIDVLVERMAASPVRVVLSCATPTWRQLERLDATYLFWHHYYPAAIDGPGLELERFTNDELKAAYSLYQDYFNLKTPHLPAGLQDQLTLPLLLRILADTYKGGAVPVRAYLPHNIYQRYYERSVPLPADQLFVENLVQEMRQQGRSTLEVKGLARNPAFRGDVWSKGRGETPYDRLQESGLLTESSDPTGDRYVQFTNQAVGAYILAHSLQGQADAKGDLVAALAGEVGNFALAWDAARMLLGLRRDRATFVALADSTDVELRELVVQSLRDLYAYDAPLALSIMKQLLMQDAEEAERTGLKAAYAISGGSDAQELFLWAVTDGPNRLRAATGTVLYFIWLKDPAFTYGLLRDLIKRIKNWPPLTAKPQWVIEFIIELPFMIYMNHPDQAGVQQALAEFYHDLALALAPTDQPSGAAAASVFSAAAGRVLITPILDTFLFKTQATEHQLFSLPPSDPLRAQLKNLIPQLLDPAVDLVPALNQLAPLLNSEILVFNLAAAHTIPIHAFRQFTALHGPLEKLYNQLEPRGRFWLLFSFSILFDKDDVLEWMPLLTHFTRRIIEEHPEVFYDDSVGLLTDLDVLLLPLGLAYGKHNREVASDSTLYQDRGMPYFEELIQAGLEQVAQGNLQAISRCLDGLRAVGFYYPRTVLQLLEQTLFDDFHDAVGRARPALPKSPDQTVQDALLPLLAAMRTLHFDQVDSFVSRMQLGDIYARRVAAQGEVDLLHRYVLWIGVYNEIVYRSIFFPFLRRRLSSEVLVALAEEPSEQALIDRYTRNLQLMFLEVNNDISRWFLPAEAAPPPA